MVDREVDGQQVFYIFLRHLRWMVDREVDWPVWVVLGRCWGLCVLSWAALRGYVGGLGPLLGPMLAISVRSWASSGGPGPLLGPLCAVLGRSWGLCWRSGGGLGTYVGDLTLLLGLYGRSWAALGASTGGLGPLLMSLWPV